MSVHYNVQINIQRVEEPQPVTDKNGYPVKSALGGSQLMTDRKVVKVLELAVTADTEEEAYSKAHRLLAANAPEPVTGAAWGQTTKKQLNPPGTRSS